MTVGKQPAHRRAMADHTRRDQRLLLLKLGLAAVGLAIFAVLLMRGADLREWIDAGLEVLRAAGPTTYFLAMAILPACGMPMAIFILPAVPLFGEQLGINTVVLLALLAVTFNLCFAYALARRGLRPLLRAIVTRLGYKLPEVASGDATDLVVLLRVTPGIPFVVQNFLAGLAEVPFARYFVVSAIIVWPLNTAFLLFGDALIQGKGKTALITLSAVVALMTVLHLVRKHYDRRRKST